MDYFPIYTSIMKIHLVCMYGSNMYEFNERSSSIHTWYKYIFHKNLIIPGVSLPRTSYLQAIKYVL